MPPSGSRDVSHAAKSGAIQVATIALQALVTVTHVLLARLFGAAVFGAYQANIAIMEMVTRAGTGGADKGMLRYVAAHRARGEQDLVRSALGTGLRLAFGIAGTFTVLLVFGSGTVARIAQEPSMEIALRLMAPAAIFTGCMYVLVQASLAAKVTHANFIVRGLGEPIFLMAAGLLAAVAGRTLVNLAVAHVLAAAATVTLAGLVVGRVFGRGEIVRAVRSPWLPGFAKFSVPLGVAELMNAILQRADIVLLTMFVGPTATAVYAASEFLTRVIGNARNVFDAVAAPVFSEALHLGQHDRLKQNLHLMTRWVTSAAAPIAVTVVALRSELLSLYGPGFPEGAAALALLALGYFINSSCGLTGYILVVAGRSRTLLANNVVVAAVNVALNLILIPRFGILGAAMGALAGVTLLHTLVLTEVALLERVFPFDWPILKPLVAAVAALAAEVAIGRAVERAAARIPLVIIAGLIAFLGTLVVLGLAPEDRRLLAGIRDRIARWRARSRRA